MTKDHVREGRTMSREEARARQPYEVFDKRFRFLGQPNAWPELLFSTG